MRRTFNANPPLGMERCKADRRPLKDGSGAQCMRRAVIRGYCKQHAKIIAALDKRPTDYSSFDR